ncbi:nucleotidyltransferase domain-containing protein [Kribbella sp. NPDC059898]|uniref:nucleotidyltransferase domain-containing protein n=1 Tax=Kribbella sp. NPDC059898 TaxID=3346995 RepID=UPI003663F414
MLQVLAGTTRPLSGRQVQQLARTGSAPGVRKVLARLRATGLVTATEAGASTLYVLNREHVAAAAVEQLAGLRQILLERIREAIKAWPVQPVHVSMFGSSARGDGDIASDVDILLVHEEFSTESENAWDDQLSELGESIRGWSGNMAQMYDLSLSELEEHFVAGEPIVQDWIKDTIPLAGPDFRRLRNQLAHRTAE